MTISTVLKGLALGSAALTLAACTGVPSRNFEPLVLDEENFYSRVNAEPIHRAEANQQVSLSQCGETGRIELSAESTVSSKEALETLLDQFRVALNRSGSNTFVLESAEWAPVGEAAVARIDLRVRGLICDL